MKPGILSEFVTVSVFRLTIEFTVNKRGFHFVFGTDCSFVNICVADTI